MPGFDGAMGFRAASSRRATRSSSSTSIEDKHRQPYGIVHGGVHCAVFETVLDRCGDDAMPRGRERRRLENHTTFVRAAREGRVRVVAKLITRGRRTQVWGGDRDRRVGGACSRRALRYCLPEPGPSSRAHGRADVLTAPASRRAASQRLSRAAAILRRSPGGSRNEPLAPVDRVRARVVVGAPPVRDEPPAMHVHRSNRTEQLVEIPATSCARRSTRRSRRSAS